MENTDNQTATTGNAAGNEGSKADDSAAEKSAAAAGEKTASKRSRVTSKTSSKKGAKKAAAAGANAGNRRLVTATLDKRQVRVQFKQGGKIVATSATYNSGNTIDKIVGFARRQLGADKIGQAKPVPQEYDGKHWNNVPMPQQGQQPQAQ